MEGLLDVRSGQRKYLNREERTAFFEAAKTTTKDKKYFALVLYYTGARLNEALALKIENLDLENRSIIIQSLKKRGRVHYRSIPVPESFLEELVGAYDIRRLKMNQKNNKLTLFNFTDRTAKRYIKALMEKAGISGPQASAKGLRHAYGVAAVEAEIPITEIQDLLGHTYIETTKIYTQVKGIDRHQLISKMWS